MTYLESDDGVEEVSRALNGAFERGITAVPTFVFEDEFVVPGAVDTASFGRILEQMRTLRDLSDRASAPRARHRRRQRPLFRDCRCACRRRL